jgi:rRNA maturation protein Nop10
MKPTLITKNANTGIAILFALLLFCFTFINAIVAQDYESDTLYFQNRLAHALSTSEVVTFSPHYLGDEVARKYAVLNDLYTYTISAEVMNTGKQTVISKPAIYNAVKKLNRNYRKLIRKKEISEEEARIKVNHVLDVAISVYTQTTDALENALRQARTHDEIAEVFERVKLT